jgi:carboxymethylenebutenolidase
MEPERIEGHFTGHDGKEIEMYQAVHKDGKRHPSVIVVHEIWGLEKNIRSIADRFAAEGYNAYAPHLFSRFGKHFTAKNIEKAMTRFFSIPENKRWSPEGMNSAISTASDDEKSIIKQIFESRAETTKVMVKDLVALLSYVAKQPSSDGEKIGSIGFCLGGGLVFQLATESHIMATSVFYGANPDPVSSISKIEGKVIASYAGEDSRVNEGLPAMIKAFTDSRKEIELKIYEKAQHAFFNDLRPTYKKEAALDAWNRTISFFDSILK